MIPLEKLFPTRPSWNKPASKRHAENHIETKVLGNREQPLCPSIYDIAHNFNNWSKLCCNNSLGRFDGWATNSESFYFPTFTNSSNGLGSQSFQLKSLGGESASKISKQPIFKFTKLLSTGPRILAVKKPCHYHERTDTFEVERPTRTLLGQVSHHIHTL